MTQELHRVSDWYSRLFNLIIEKEHQPFKFGKNDCTLFGADVVLAITGVDLAASYRGKYRSLKGGMKLLKADGYTSNVDYLEKNFPETSLAFANAGDLCLINTEEGEAIAVLTGTVATGIGPNGLVRFPLEKISRTFKVG